MIFFKAKIGMNDINQLLHVNQNSNGLNFFYFLNLLEKNNPQDVG
jgi:hypothetical protein